MSNNLTFGEYPVSGFNFENTATVEGKIKKCPEKSSSTARRMILASLGLKAESHSQGEKRSIPKYSVLTLIVILSS